MKKGKLTMTEIVSKIEDMSFQQAQEYFNQLPEF